MYRIFVIGATIANGIYTWRRLRRAPPEERRRELLQFAAWPLYSLAKNILVMRLAPRHGRYAHRPEQVALGCSALFVAFMSLVALADVIRQLKENEK